MRKIIWLLIALLSLLISVKINFNLETDIIGFLIISLFTALIIFGIITLIIKSIQNIKEKNTKKAILFGVLSIVLIVIFYLGYLTLSPGDVCLTAITPADFRTNIFTGECDFEGYSSCVSSNPWYYESGCNISSQEKIEVFKKSEWHEQAIEECSTICDKSGRNVRLFFAKDISCEDLVSWGSISCN